MVASNRVIACLAVLLSLTHQISGLVVPDELVPENLVYRDPESKGGLVINEGVLNELLKNLYSSSRTTESTDEHNNRDTEGDGYEENHEKNVEDDGHRSYQANSSNHRQQRTKEISHNKSYRLLQRNVQPYNTFLQRQIKQTPTNLSKSKEDGYQKGLNHNPFIGVEQPKLFRNRKNNQYLAGGAQVFVQKNNQGEMLNNPYRQQPTEQPPEFNGRQFYHNAGRRPSRPEPEQQPRRRALQIGKVSVVSVSRTSLPPTMKSSVHQHYY